VHTRHCPRHVFAAPPAHFSGVNVTRGRGRAGIVREGQREERGRWGRTRASFAKRDGPMRERERKKEKRARGMEIILREYLGWGKTYCQRTKHLPQKASPSLLRLPSSVHHRPGRTPHIHLSYRFTRDLTTRRCGFCFFSAGDGKF